MIKIKDSIISLFGVAISQSIFFICIWFIGRNFGAEELGSFNYNLSLGMFLGSIFVFRYELTCVSDNSNYSLKSLFKIVVLSSFVAVLLLIVILLSRKEEYFIVVLFSLSFIWQQTIVHYMNSLRSYSIIAGMRTVINVLFLVFILLLIQPIKSTIDIFDIYAFTYLAVCVFSIFLIIKVYKYKLSSDELSFFSFLKENYRYPIYIFPSTLCASVTTYAMSILLPIWFGTMTAGFFALAYRVGFFPVSLIAQSIGGVFRRDMLAAVNTENSSIKCKEVYIIYAKWLLLLSLIYGVAGMVLFKPCVEFFFGVEWVDSISYYVYMIPLFCAQIIYIPLSQSFLAFKKQKMDFKINFMMAVMLLIVLSFAKKINLSAFDVVFCFSMTAFII
ncbi:TPA: lipopolysaccharide biosynthesis protein, partial [Klebsiella quasipneumoniae]